MRPDRHARADTHERRERRSARRFSSTRQLVGREVGKSIGARFLAADVNPASVAFSERAGFVSLKADAGKPGGLTPMMLDLQPIAEALGVAGKCTQRMDRCVTADRDAFKQVSHWLRALDGDAPRA